MQRGVLPDVRVERLEVGETLLAGELQHLALDLGDAFQPELMDLLCRTVRGRLLPHSEAISRVAVGQGPDPGIDAAMRRIVLAHELGELRISWRYFIPGSVFDAFTQALPVRFGD